MDSNHLETTWLGRQARRLLSGRVKDRLSTSDAVQEAQLRAVRSGMNFEDRGLRRAWFLRVLRNLVISESRRRKLVSFEGDLPGQGKSPSSLVEEAEGTRCARARLRVLPPRDRNLVELRVLEGLPFSEIASRLGLNSEGHARVIFQRSLGRLRRGTDDEQEGR
ncbi:MAG: sigma-70 family RNA polymerase sigma factor [Planctomycetota bacterium]|nr:sigma-70 family RNA polymerase sigma factor [Planctomycetota bacterium]